MLTLLSVDDDRWSSMPSPDAMLAMVHRAEAARSVAAEGLAALERLSTSDVVARMRAFVSGAERYRNKLGAGGTPGRLGLTIMHLDPRTRLVLTSKGFRIASEVSGPSEWSDRGELVTHRRTSFRALTAEDVHNHRLDAPTSIPFFLERLARAIDDTHAKRKHGIIAPLWVVA